jgi:hypothetical protein
MTAVDHRLGRGALALLVLVVLAVSGATAVELLAAPPDAAVGEATGDDPTAVEQAAVPAPSSGAWYCPVVGEEDETAVLSVAAVGEFTADVTVTRHVGDGDTVETDLELAPGEAADLELVDGDAAHPSTIGWSGSPVVAAWRIEGSDTGGARCEEAPDPVVHLTGFDTTAPSTSTLHLFNAFDRDAVVRVTFGTSTGPVALALTDNVAVPAGGTTTLVLDEFEPEQPDLAVTVETLTGRVVTQGVVALGSAPNQPGPTGIAVVAGTGAPDLDGAAAFARAGDTGTSWLSLYNPDEREAAVQVQVSDPVAEEAAALEDVTVPPGSVVRVELDGTSASVEFGTRVESLNEVPVLVTRLTAIRAADGAEGVAASSTDAPSHRWALVGGGTDGRTSRVALYNPTAEAVTVSVDAGAGTPSSWSGLILRPNERRALDLDELEDEEGLPRSVAVEADGPVVADLRTQAPTEDAIRVWTAGGVPSIAWEGPRSRPAVERDDRLSTRPGGSASEGGGGTGQE